MKKLTKTQKKELKAKIFKVIHVLCYILSALFILIMVITVAHSCAKPKKASGNTPKLNTSSMAYTYPNDYYKYLLRFDEDNEYNISLDEQYALGLGSVDLGTTYADAQRDITIEILKNDTSDVAYTFDVDSERVELKNITCEFRTTYINEVDDYQYRLSHVWLNYDSDIEYNIVILYNSSFYAYDIDAYMFLGNASVVVSNFQPNNALNVLYQATPLQNFVFNKAFNYNAPINLSLSSYFGGSTASISEVIIGGIYRIRYDVGFFYSNGMLYDQIVVDYLDSGSLYFDTGNGVIKGTSGQLSYFALGYRRVDNGLIDFINYRDLTQVTYNSNIVSANLNSTTWQNDSFRYLSFVDQLNDSLKVKINAFNNNNQSESYGEVYSNQNIFTLLTSAFTSLTPLLSLAILPGITIGTLVFIPLVVLVVFAIIHIVKK